MGYPTKIPVVESLEAFFASNVHALKCPPHDFYKKNLRRSVFQSDMHGSVPHMSNTRNFTAPPTKFICVPQFPKQSSTEAETINESTIEGNDYQFLM